MLQILYIYRQISQRISFINNNLNYWFIAGCTHHYDVEFVLDFEVGIHIADQQVVVGSNHQRLAGSHGNRLLLWEAAAAVVAAVGNHGNLAAVVGNHGNSAVGSLLGNRNQVVVEGCQGQLEVGIGESQRGEGGVLMAVFLKD